MINPGPQLSNRSRGITNALDFYWAFNGSSTWNLETIPDITTSGAAMTTYPGGVHVVNADDVFSWQDSSNQSRIEEVERLVMTP